VVGTDNTITLDTGNLTFLLPPTPGAITGIEHGPVCYTFSRGTVTVKDPQGRTIFTDSLRGGLLVRPIANGSEVTIDATLVPNTMVGSGFAAFSFSFNPLVGHEHHLKIGLASVHIATTPTPKPGALELPGTGVNRLPALARRKLKLRR